MSRIQNILDNQGSMVRRQLSYQQCVNPEPSEYFQVTRSTLCKKCNSQGDGKTDELGLFPMK